MKRYLAALALACLATPLALAADLKAELLAMEKMMWTAWGKRDTAPFKTHLTDNVVHIVAGTAPVSGRDAVIKDIQGHNCELKSFALNNPTLQQLSADVVILSYTATQDTTCGRTKLPPKLFASATYVKQKGKWLAARYQETPIE